MTPQEKRLADRYHAEHIGLHGHDHVYAEEFKVIEPGRGNRARWVDAIIVAGRDSIDDRDLRCLNGRDITLVQVKLTQLNAWLVGQAVFTPRLLARSAEAQGWKPGTVTSVALCDTPRGTTMERRVLFQRIIADRFAGEIRIVTLEVPQEDRNNNASVKRDPEASDRYVEAVAEPGILVEKMSALLSG